MNKIIGDAMAFGLRLKRCSDPTLADKGAELISIGRQLDDAWRDGELQKVATLRMLLRRLSEEVATILGRSVGVVFLPVVSAEDRWTLFFGAVEPAPVRPQQFMWLAEEACAA